MNKINILIVALIASTIHCYIFSSAQHHTMHKLRESLSAAEKLYNHVSGNHHRPNHEDRAIIRTDSMPAADTDTAYDTLGLKHGAPLEEIQRQAQAQAQTQSQTHEPNTHRQTQAQTQAQAQARAQSQTQGPNTHKHKHNHKRNQFNQ